MEKSDWSRGALTGRDFWIYYTFDGKWAPVSFVELYNSELDKGILAAIVTLNLPIGILLLR